MKNLFKTVAAAALFLAVLVLWKFQSNIPEAQKQTPSSVRAKYEKWKTHAEISAKQKKKAEQEKLGSRPEFPDEYARFHAMIRTNHGEAAPSYPFNYKLEELAKAKAAAAQRGLHKTAAKLPWVERGPNNVGGRTRGLIVDPADPARKTWYAGSVGGGIWKTTDGGQTWANKTPELPNLATTSLAQAASNPNVIYAGTGEGFFNADAVNGDAVFKSFDRGETWQQLAATANNLEHRFSLKNQGKEFRLYSGVQNAIGCP